jgi:hypothetical protein
MPTFGGVMTKSEQKSTSLDSIVSPATKNPDITMACQDTTTLSCLDLFYLDLVVHCLQPTVTQPAVEAKTKSLLQGALECCFKPL